MPVQPAVGKHDDGVTPSHAQQFIGTIKSGVGESAGVFAESPEEERRVGGEKRRWPDTTPPDVRGPFDDLVCLAKLRLGDSLSHGQESTALTVDVRPQLEVGILDGIETLPQSLLDGHLAALVRHESPQISKALESEGPGSANYRGIARPDRLGDLAGGHRSRTRSGRQQKLHHGPLDRAAEKCRPRSQGGGCSILVRSYHHK